MAGKKENPLIGRPIPITERDETPESKNRPRKKDRRRKRPSDPKKHPMAGKGQGKNWNYDQMQKAFVREYLAMPMLERSPAKAAIAAGYSPKNANAQAAKLMEYPQIKRQILLHSEKVLEITSIDDAWVLNELAGLWSVPLSDLFDDEGDLLHVKDMGLEAQKLITSFDVDHVLVKDEVGDERLVPKVTKIRLLNRMDIMKTIGAHMRVNAFGSKQEAEKNSSLAELMRGLTHALSKSTADRRLPERLVNDGVGSKSEREVLEHERGEAE